MMFIDKSGGLYQGEMRDGDREATAEEIAAWKAARALPEFTDAIQKRLDDFASTRRYDNVESLPKYSNLTDEEIASLPAQDRAATTRYRAECRYLLLKTAQTWAVGERILAQVQANQRPMPTGIADIEADLPVLEWPV